MGGIVRAEKGVLYDIGGIEDHVHMYIRWRTDASISDLMRNVKASSSKWLTVNTEYPSCHANRPSFGKVSCTHKSQEGAVKAYIAGQRDHHKKEGFTSELLRVLRLHEIEFDEQYVFD